jgi:hypothetical protein
VRALAIDPGGTTGYAMGYLDVNANELTIECGQQEWSMGDMYEMLDNWIAGESENMPVHVIYEDFSYRNAARAGLDLTPVKLIGIIELYKERYEPNVGFTKQSAATGKAFWNNDKLKAKGIYARGKDHGRDATRHLMHWLAFGAGSQYGDVNTMKFMLEVN